MIFLDTSVLIAIAQVSHERHAPSRALWNHCTPGRAAISAHTLAETYNVLTAMPPALRISPRDAVLALETFLKRLTAIELTAAEYIEALRQMANLGHSGGIVYDALHLACARKIQAETIYTWNAHHFRLVAPDLAQYIETP
ncbi:MAG: type II toxin-antitoxin system VapC family toxin [Terracidiphilus sp.]